MKFEYRYRVSFEKFHSIWNSIWLPINCSSLNWRLFLWDRASFPDQGREPGTTDLKALIDEGSALPWRPRRHRTLIFPESLRPSIPSCLKAWESKNPYLPKILRLRVEFGQQNGASFASFREGESPWNLSWLMSLRVFDSYILQPSDENPANITRYGIENWRGNICYFNMTVQALFAMPHFRRLVFEG